MVVSDNYRENTDYISERYNFENWSVKQIYSFEYRLVKSNPEFFIKLLTDLKDCGIEEMLLIDDSTEEIESAQNYGIKGIVFKSNEQVIGEVKEHGR